MVVLPRIGSLSAVLEFPKHQKTWEYRHVSVPSARFWNFLCVRHNGYIAPDFPPEPYFINRMYRMETAFGISVEEVLRCEFYPVTHLPECDWMMKRMNVKRVRRDEFKGLSRYFHCSRSENKGNPPVWAYRILSYIRSCNRIRIRYQALKS